MPTECVHIAFLELCQPQDTAQNISALLLK